MSPEKWLVLPVVLHFFMVAAIGVLMGRSRRQAVGDGRVSRNEIRNNNSAWPEDVLQIGNNFNNQFQLPIYWAICVGFVLLTGMVDSVLILLAWAFLILRVLHAYEHIGVNFLLRRFYFFLAGFVTLIAMWAWFAIRWFVTG